MSITIQRGKSEYVYRINPYQPREIDRKPNRHRARWERYTTCASAEGATKMLLKLETESEGDE